MPPCARVGMWPKIDLHSWRGRGTYRCSCALPAMPVCVCAIFLDISRVSTLRGNLCERESGGYKQGGIFRGRGFFWKPNVHRVFDYERTRTRTHVLTPSQAPSDGKPSKKTSQGRNAAAPEPYCCPPPRPQPLPHEAGTLCRHPASGPRRWLQAAAAESDLTRRQLWHAQHPREASNVSI